MKKCIHNYLHVPVHPAIKMGTSIVGSNTERSMASIQAIV